MTAAPPTHTDLKSTLEEMRASVAARGTRKGLAARAGLTGAIQKAFLELLSVLLAILEDFRAGRLARIAPVAELAGDGAVADPSPQPSPTRGEGGVLRGFGVENGEARAACWSAGYGGAHEGYPSPSRIGSIFASKNGNPSRAPPSPTGERDDN